MDRSSLSPDRTGRIAERTPRRLGRGVPQPVATRLRDDQRGVTVAAFAIVVPALTFLLIALSDLGYRSYVQAVLDGAVVAAGRDHALTGDAGDQNGIDAAVRDAVGALGPGMTFVSWRASYSGGSVTPEAVAGTYGNGRLGARKCFRDDVSRYTMTVTYTPLFRTAGLFGWSSMDPLTSSTLRKSRLCKAQSAATM